MKPLSSFSFNPPVTPSAQLQENLRVMQSPKLSLQEEAKWLEYGNLIYGNGQDAFKTEWL